MKGITIVKLKVVFEYTSLKIKLSIQPSLDLITCIYYMETSNEWQTKHTTSQ